MKVNRIEIAFWIATVMIAAAATALPVRVYGQSPPGRLLASNCFQCHGTNGRALDGMERLAGKSAHEIYEELLEMKGKPANSNIMHVHARGYTDAQLRLIADYLSRQSR